MATTNTKTTVKTAEAEVKKNSDQDNSGKDRKQNQPQRLLRQKTKAAKKTTVAKTTRKPAAKKRNRSEKADVFVQFGGKKEFSEEAIMSKSRSCLGSRGQESICDQESKKTLYRRKMARHIM